MGKTKSTIRQTSQDLTSKLNTLAIQILDDLLEAKRKGKQVEFESFKTYLIAIKEIKDLVKVNQKTEEMQWGELFSEEEDLGNVVKLEDLFDEKE